MAGRAVRRLCSCRSFGSCFVDLPEAFQKDAGRILKNGSIRNVEVVNKGEFAGFKTKDTPDGSFIPGCAAFGGHYCAILKPDAAVRGLRVHEKVADAVMVAAEELDDIGQHAWLDGSAHSNLAAAHTTPIRFARPNQS